MKRIPLKSTNIVSVGYDSENSVLEVEFRSGSVYQYFQVPEKIFAGLMSARSKGQYFDAYIKKGKYTYKKMTK